MGVKYGNCKVSTKVLKSIEDKASKAAFAKNTNVRAKSKKRKDAGQPKVLARKWKAPRAPKGASSISSEEEEEGETSVGVDEGAHGGEEVA